MKPNIPDTVLALVAKHNEVYALAYRFAPANDPDDFPWMIRGGKLIDTSNWLVEASRSVSSYGWRRDDHPARNLRDAMVAATYAVYYRYEASGAESQALLLLADGIEKAWSNP